MPEPNALDLNFGDLATPPPGADSPDPMTTRRIAAAAGAAEGFTPRTAPTLPPRRRPPNIQLNFKVPEEIRDRFQEAYLKVSATDRTIRSASEFFISLFEDWERRRE